MPFEGRHRERDRQRESEGPGERERQGETTRGENAKGNQRKGKKKGYGVKMRMIEIYNETCVDLLSSERVEIGIKYGAK